METIFGFVIGRSRLLPEVVSENGQTRPDGRVLGTSCQHSTQAKLAFEYTDRRFDPAAKPL
jgi:hypothetical protein